MQSRTAARCSNRAPAEPCYLYVLEFPSETLPQRRVRHKTCDHRHFVLKMMFNERRSNHLIPLLT